MKEDVNLGLDNEYPEPILELPTEVDPLYVEKPIDKYEPSKFNLSRLRAAADQDRIIKRKWKPHPQT